MKNSYNIHTARQASRYLLKCKYVGIDMTRGAQVVAIPLEYFSSTINHRD